MFNTPILFIVFNRFEKTKKVFGAIKKIKPTTLYIAADGPRTVNTEEEYECKKIRKYLLKNINWRCEVKTLFRKKNLGCKKAVSTAITWFFKNVEEGIVIEDDCLPNTSFFLFCSKMLKKYRYDTRIMLISGNNFQFGQKRGSGSYYFSKLCSIWGWASWKRVWQHYDVNLGLFPKFVKEKTINNIFNHWLERVFWLTIFDNLYRGKGDTWDHQLAFLIWSQNGLTIVPNKNLVSNIGFDKDSSRTSDTNSILSNIKTEAINNIIDPLFVVQDKEADWYTFKRVYIPMINLRNLIQSLLEYLRKKTKCFPD